MSLRRSLTGIAVAAALGLPTGAANALSYASFFDPPDFEGNSTFFVADACLSGPDGFRTINANCTFSWLTAEVTLKDEFSYDPNDPYTFTTFNPTPGTINNIYVENNALAGVNSGRTVPFAIANDPNPAFNNIWEFQYEFSGPLIILSHGSGGFGLGTVLGFQDGSQTPFSTANVQNFTRILQVPEPGTLGLMLGALGGAWLARRRKSI